MTTTKSRKKTRRPTQKKTPVLTNHIAIVLDCSGSMEHLRHKVVEVFNGIVSGIATKAAQFGQRTTVSLCKFSMISEMMFFCANPATLRSLQMSDYIPSGSTAMLHGIGETIRRLSGLPDANDEETSFVLIGITDGFENASHYLTPRYTPESTRDTILQRQSTGRWTITFQCPRGDKSVLQGFGIPDDNIREWDQTKRGAEEVKMSTQSALGNYFDARSRGVRALDTFYATVDMSKVKSRDVAKKLTDLSANFKVHTVPGECAIKDFVEQKTRQPYVIGQAYYQLTKAEEIQPQKAVLVMEKGKKAVWGGSEARDLIGLPHGVKAKVQVGNLSKWDVFTQSTSVNRKLVRGTRLLIDMSQMNNLPATW